VEQIFENRDVATLLKPLKVCQVFF